MQIQNDPADGGPSGELALVKTLRNRRKADME
jgi:hypothetical protein